jgi:hypothetical protein
VAPGVDVGNLVCATGPVCVLRSRVLERSDVKKKRCDENVDVKRVGM